MGNVSRNATRNFLKNFSLNVSGNDLKNASWKITGNASENTDNVLTNAFEQFFKQILKECIGKCFRGILRGINDLVNALSGNNSRKAFGDGSEKNVGISQKILRRIFSHSFLGFKSRYIYILLRRCINIFFKE